MANSDIIKIGFDYRASLAQFEKETNGVFDGISNKAGKQKITIQLDAKDDKVIDKIKELQKLKLDKFTFEFGDSGLKEQLQTFDKLETKINEIINLSKGINNNLGQINNGNALKAELDLYHMTEKRKVSYDEIINKIQSIISLQEKSQKLESKKSLDGKYYQEIFDENINWVEKEKTLENISLRLKEIYSNSQGKITLISNDDIKEAAYLLDMLKGAGEALDNLTAKELKFFSNKKFENKDLFNFVDNDNSISEQIEKIQIKLSNLYKWFEKFEGVSLNPNIKSDIDRLVSEIEVGEKEASEYANELLKIFNIRNTSPNISVNNISQIDKLENKISELTQKYKELQNKTTEVSGKDLNLVDNEEFKKLSQEVSELKNQFDGLKTHMQLLDDYTVPTDRFFELQSQVETTTIKVSNLVDEFTKLSNAQKALSSTPQESNISSGMKDAFPSTEATADTKSEIDGMEQVEKTIKEAVQAKKDFATANEGVQSSIDGSKSPLQLEAELMDQIAKSAREAADAKKEFVEANNKVKDSANKSNNDLNNGHSENAEPSGVKKYKKKGYKAHDTGNHDNEKKVSNKAELGQALKDLQSEIIASIDKSTSFVKEVTDFYDSQDNLVKTQMKVGDKNGGMRTYTTSYSMNKDGNATAWTSHIETQKIAEQAKQEASNIQAEWDKNLKAIQDYMDSMTKLNNLKAKDKGTGSEANQIVLQTQNVEKLKQAAWDARQNLSSMQAENPDIITWKQWVDMMKLFDQSSKGSAESAAKLKDVLNNIKAPSLDKYENKLSSYLNKTGGYNATIARFNDGGWTSDIYLKNVQAVKDAVKQYEDLLSDIKAKGGIASEDDIQKLKEYESEIKNTIATVTNMSAAEKGYNFVSGQKELDKIHKLLNENSKMSSEAKAKIRAYYAEIESGNPSMSLDKIHGEILKIYNAEVEAGRAGRTLWDTLKNSGFHQIAAQMAGMIGVYDVINVIKQAASTVTELNTQITELAKVSEQSSSQIYADFDSYADIAKKVRGTISDTIAATADWSKNGYSIPDAKQLAEVSQLYKNVGDGIDINTANESLISTLKGFQLEADQAEHIVDVFNEVSNNEAISSGGIGEALQRSAASFNAASTSLEKSVSLVTATNSVLQNPEKVGKQILAYLYSNVMKIKVAISVKILRRTRPRKDYNVCFNY